MKTSQILLLAALLITVPAIARAQTNQPPSAAKTNLTSNLPRLIDVGASKCIPCKLMAPILEELKHEYAGKMEVQFIDALQDPEAARKLNVEIIPTQIFFGSDGKELFRHQGFYGKEDILNKWKELGVELSRR